MNSILLSKLRNIKTKTYEFRKASHLLGYVLAFETEKFLKQETISIETHWAKTKGSKLKSAPNLIVILRGGLALLGPFLDTFQQSKVGFIGLKRDEITAKADLYYLNLPKMKKDEQVIILDPTIATGGSAVSAIKILIDYGIKEENIIFVSILSTKKGIENMKNNFPRIEIITIKTDPKLNKKKFIVPGFGDFGDRYFGTEHNI